MGPVEEQVVDGSIGTRQQQQVLDDKADRVTSNGQSRAAGAGVVLGCEVELAFVSLLT